MKVLIADDEPIVCTIFSHHIKQYASPYITYEFVQDGFQLINKCTECLPDLIITDINMPNISGLEAIEEIFKTYSDNLKIYVLSGHTDFDLVRTAFRLGVSDYIPKPIKYLQVEALLRKEEKQRFLGLLLEDVYKLKDENLALKISETIQNLANSYGNNDESYYLYLKEYSDFFDKYKIKIEDEFFSTKFKDYDKTITQVEYLHKLSLDNSKEEKHLIDKIKDEVHLNYKNPVFGLDFVANTLGYSTQYLSMLFKKTTNMNFSSYLTNVRIENSKKLLITTNMKIKDIANECGYSYTNYFIKVFNKSEGCTPFEWKKSNI